METDNASPDDRMEYIAPPDPPEPSSDGARESSANDREVLRSLATVKSIAGAAGLFGKACEGGDSYDNNCAHFLSDAFLRAGYTELETPAPCVNARCGTFAKRVIRARDMWCWFKQMATQARNALPKNEGFWAGFQLDENVYWGGHVIIFDSDRNLYYGTAHYPNWNQYCYQW